MRKIGGAVNRVNHPGIIRAGIFDGVFFGQVIVQGEAFADDVQHRFLAGDVGLGNQVGLAFEFVAYFAEMPPHHLGGGLQTFL